MKLAQECMWNIDDRQWVETALPQAIEAEMLIDIPIQAFFAIRNSLIRFFCRKPEDRILLLDSEYGLLGCRSLLRSD
jgi:hypothetical protein